MVADVLPFSASCSDVNRKEKDETSGGFVFKYRCQRTAIPDHLDSFDSANGENHIPESSTAKVPTLTGGVT
jgi:hypothetical protein